jgi:DNA polymerase
MNKKEMLKLLRKEVEKCTKCKELVEGRIQTVLDRGNPEAKIVLCAESPGKDEAEQGFVLVGRAGQLLDKIIEACGLTGQVYLCNILRCRPPDNRKPTEDEAKNCKPFLDLQLEVIAPDYIVCLGATAATGLLGLTGPVGAMRGRWYSHKVGDKEIKALVTYHPSFLLRNPPAKADVWKDLQLLLKDLGKI